MLRLRGPNAKANARVTVAVGSESEAWRVHVRRLLANGRAKEATRVPSADTRDSGEPSRVASLIFTAELGCGFHCGAHGLDCCRELLGRKWLLHEGVVRVGHRFFIRERLRIA